MTVTNVTPPVISGTTVQGNALHSTPGTWTSDDPLAPFAYQWERCDGVGANCVDIYNAIASSYILTSADVGHTLRVRVTAVELPTPPPPVGTVYVATTGSDSAGNGSASAPWKTIKKACDNTSAGDTISVAAGTYDETQTCRLADGVSLVGAGEATTIIRPASSFTPLLLVQNTLTTQTISDLTLDGVSKTRSRQGLIMQSTISCKVLRCTIEDFAGTATPTWHIGGGIHIAGGSDAEIGNCTITNCANTGSPYSSGGFAIGGHTGAVIHDNTLTESNGYCVKDSGSGSITNCEFYNNTMSTSASFMDICFELESVDALNCRLHHNSFNRTVSLTDSAGGTLGSGYRWRVDHNYFPLAAAYGIELDHASSEIDHNYQVGGWVFIANFRAAQANNLVHHNVLDMSGNPCIIVRNDGGSYTNFQVYENTCVIRSQTRDGILSFAAAGSTGTLVDNIFYFKPAGTMSPFSVNQGGFSINHNAHWQITSVGAGTNIIAATAATIPDTGSFPAKYTPPAGNPAIGVGAFADGAWSDVGPQ